LSAPRQTFTAPPRGLPEVLPASLDHASPAVGALDAVYIVYWSLRDPLCQSQSLPVLRALARRGRTLGLVTFEQPPWAVPVPERAAVAAELRAQGLHWAPLEYHKRPPVLSTLWDIGAGARRAARAFRGHGGVRLFHGRGTVPAAMAYLASRMTGALFLNDADGPLSEEYVDAGRWSRGSFAHRATAWAERRFLRAADAVAVLTEHRRREVEPTVGGPVTVLPCAVDTARFDRDPGEGARLRRDLGLTGRVLVYTGKASGWYLGDAVVDFAAEAAGVLGEVSLLVLTPDPPDVFLTRAAARGVRCLVRRADPSEVPAYLSAGDAGLSFRLQTPSQRACSPIKNGEYLACGLPVVTTAGAGDYSDMVVRRRVGVVLASADAAGFRKAAGDLAALLADPQLPERARAAARAEVGLEEVVLPHYVSLYERLLGTPR
jgi:glycosyltransferase involved in cell wall biosynthesis